MGSQPPPLLHAASSLIALLRQWRSLSSAAARTGSPLPTLPVWLLQRVCDGTADQPKDVYALLLLRASAEHAGAHHQEHPQQRGRAHPRPLSCLEESGIDQSIIQLILSIEYTLATR